MQHDIPFSFDDHQAWYSFVIIQDVNLPWEKAEDGKLVPLDGQCHTCKYPGGKRRINIQVQPRLPLIDRLLGSYRSTLRALLVAVALASPIALAAAHPAAAEKVIRPEGGGPVYTGSVGPWEFYKVEYANGVTACSMMGWVGRAKAPSFSLGAYYTKAGKFDGNEIRFEGIPGSLPTVAAATAQLQIGGSAFAMEHPENIAHTGFFLKNWSQFDAVIEALTTQSEARGNRSFSVVQGGKRYKFDARDWFGK